MYTNDLKKSNRAFINIIYPYLKTKKWWSDTSIICTENSNDQLYKSLDQLCGIDFIIKRGNELYSLAVRLQLQEYNTFTIRSVRDTGSTTELKKRTISLQNKSMYPSFTLHGYLDNWDGNILSIGYIKTERLYDFINKHEDLIRINSANTGGDNNKFITVNWSDLLRFKYKVEVYPENISEKIEGYVIDDIEDEKNRNKLKEIIKFRKISEELLNDRFFNE